MLNVNRADVEQMVKIIDYILENEDKVSVEQLMADCGLTFEEYRLMSALSMPAIRKKNEYKGMKVRATYYKAALERLRADDKELDGLLAAVKEYLDRRFKEDKADEGDVHTVARGEGEDVIQEGGEGDDWDDGHPEEWAI
jgi:hypothetical protein